MTSSIHKRGCVGP